MSTDIHPVHEASKLWERVTSLLLSCVSALSLLLVKLDYDFTKVCLLKFLSFLCSHKNSQKSNNFGKRQKWNESIFQIEARFWDQIYLHLFSVKKYFSWCILFWIEQILNYKNVMDENWSHQENCKSFISGWHTLCFFLPFFGSNVIVHTAIWQMASTFQGERGAVVYQKQLWKQAILLGQTQKLTIR